MKAMMDMASSRRGTIVSQRDMEAHTNLAIEDYLNSINMMPRDIKIRSLVSYFNMPEHVAAQTIDTLEANAETYPLTMLQPMQPGDGGQFLQFRMGPNYEMALFIAQTTGAVIVTDSETRWIEFQAAQHLETGAVFYPWNDIYGRMRRIPLDYHMVDSYTKTQYHFAAARAALKHAHELVLEDIRDPKRLKIFAESLSKLNGLLGQIDSDKTAEFVNGDFRTLVPDGGIYDSNVQRLLALSGCLSYDHKVRAVYCVGLKL